MTEPTDTTRNTPDWRRQPVNTRPGFLIRRLNQIHTALFNEVCGSADITPIMYSVLSALAQGGPMDQSSLARNIAVKKANMINLIERMQQRDLISRKASDDDGRVRVVSLTAPGRALLDEVDHLAEQAHHRTLEDLSPEQQRALVALLKQIVDAKGRKLDF